MTRRFGVVALALMGCAETLEGPAPSVDDLGPGLVCNDQLTTVVTLSGKQFAPLAEGVLSDAPGLNVPDVFFDRASAIDGSPADGSTDLSTATTWLDASTMEVTLTPGVLPSGVFDVRVANPDGQEAVGAGLVAAVDPPTLARTVPALECVAQADQTITAEGTGFLSVEGALPTVQVGDVTLSASALGDCFDLAGPVEGQSCTTADVVLPMGSLPPGLHAVALTNPEPASCSTVEAFDLEVVPPPTLTDAVPRLECVDQADQTFDLTGEGFVVLPDGTLPTVTLGDYSAPADAAGDCAPLAGPDGGQTCRSLVFTLPMASVPPGVHDVVVANPAPADCVSTEPVQVEVVPRPTLDQPEVALECLAEADQSLVLTGTGFIVLADGTPPTVTVGSYAAPATAASFCEPLAGPAGGSTCTELTVTLPVEAESTGVVDVVVTNPDPAECSTTESVQLELVPEPVLVALEPTLECIDQADQGFVLTGSDFLVLPDGTLPTVTVGTWSGLADSASDCSSLTGPSGGESCATLAFTLPVGAEVPGLHDVSVTNPTPAECSTEALQTELIGAPVVDVLVPPEACALDQTVPLELQGSGFLDLDGALPTVTFDGAPLAGVALADCATPLTTMNGVLCDTLTVELPADVAAVNGDYDLVVTNPVPAECSTTETFRFGDPPTIASIDPAQVCADPAYGFDVDVFGTDFSEASTVVVGTEAVPTTYVDPTHVVGSVPGGLIGPGLYDITIESGSDTCATTAFAVLEVTELPIIFSADPTVVPNIIPVTSTAFVSGINGTVTSVAIVDEAGTSTPVTFQWDPAQPAVIEFDVPEGMPEGSYDLVVSDTSGCVPVLDDAFFVEADLTLDLVAITPSFGWTDGVTPVTLTATGTPPFEDPPRVYLSPLVPGPGTTATELRAVNFVDGATLDAVVPAGLAVDQYNVVVVNPTSGEVGLLEPPDGFEVVADLPPYIDALAPATIPSADTVVTVQGGGFGDPAVDPDPVVDLLCYDPSADDCNAGTGNGSYTPYADVTVLAWSADSLQIEAPGGAIGGGVCEVTVTRPSDATFVTYASLSVTNPAQNLYDWRPASVMTTPRAGAMATAGRVTANSRFLYALGGENPADGLLDTVERARIDPFGGLGPWVAAPESVLPVPLVNASVAQIGRFVYVVGGNDGTGPVTDVWRAQVLDPLEAPEMTANLSITVDPQGLGEGTWIYRVAALFDAADDDNPGGESLSSDPFVVRLPSVAPDALQLDLEWTPVAGAVGYRIYRSSTGSGNEEHLADVLNGPGQTRFTDVGDATDPAGPRPLPVGALGQWAALPPLPTAREGACVSWGDDPLDPAMSYLYVGGGSDGIVPQSSIVWLDVLRVDDRDQDAGAWVTGSDTMQQGRWMCSGYRATSDLNASVAPGDTWIYFGMGHDDLVGGVTNDLEAGLITPGGFLDLFQPVRGGSNRAGYGAALASDFLYAFGGGNGGPNASADSSKICEGENGAGCGGAFAPQNTNWNATGTSLCESRYRMGSVQESSLIFAVGGDDGSGATATVDFTNF